MKKLQELQQIGLTVDKSHDVAYGVVGGYKFIVNFLSQQRQYTIMTTVKNDSDENAIMQYLESINQQAFVNWTNYNNHVVMINLKNDKKLTVYEIQNMIQSLASQLTQLGYVQCCRHCGEAVAVDACSINGNNDMACTGCVSHFADNQTPLKEVNLPLGIVGALAGSIIGVLVWVIIYRMGFVAGITGFIMAVCCFKGYGMLGGRIDNKGIWIAVITSIVMLAVAEMIAVAFEIQGAMTDVYAIELSLTEAFRMIPLFLEDSEFLGAVISDLGAGYVFMAVASFSYIRNIHRRVRHEGVVERLG